MGLINPAGIKNTTGDIITAIFTKIIPSVNELDRRVKELEQQAGKAPAPRPAAPAPAPAPETPPVDTEEKATSNKKPSTKKK